MLRKSKTQTLNSMQASQSEEMFSALPEENRSKWVLFMNQ